MKDEERRGEITHKNKPWIRQIEFLCGKSQKNCRWPEKTKTPDFWVWCSVFRKPLMGWPPPPGASDRGSVWMLHRVSPSRNFGSTAAFSLTDSVHNDTKDKLWYSQGGMISSFLKRVLWKEVSFQEVILRKQHIYTYKATNLNPHAASFDSVQKGALIALLCMSFKPNKGFDVRLPPLGPKLTPLPLRPPPWTPTTGQRKTWVCMVSCLHFPHSSFWFVGVLFCKSRTKDVFHTLFVLVLLRGACEQQFCFYMYDTGQTETWIFFCDV